MKKSWKTTLGGVLIALGTAMTQAQGVEWLPSVGAALVAIGALIGGVSARDNKVNSKDAGAE